jgi:hypothetical protein
MLSVLVVSCLIALAFAGERRLREEPFRFGIEGEPGLKSVNGEKFQLDYGLVFKIQERFSVIPRFGLHYYDYDKTQTINGRSSTNTSHDEAMNIGITFRYEFARRLTIENTRFEYNTEKREFSHYYYASPLRPYIQLHAGTFTGFGGGLSYYLAPQVGIGIGADMGWNWLALSDNQAGFAVIAPKAVVSFLFN